MNGYLKKMGYGPEDRVLITHIDDIGFCHAANTASFECLDVGAASCGSILTTAPWFLEAAAYCRDTPGYDVGVHLTLTCEFPYYRWPALSTRDKASGLLDGEGYLWHTSRDAVKNIPEIAARDEMRAQIDTALNAGIDITHIDTHMGTVVHPKFLQLYLNLAAEYGVPAFLPNITRERLQGMKQIDNSDDYLAIMEQIDSNEVPTLDEIIIDTLLPITEDFAEKSAFYRDLIENIKPGLTHLLFHTAKMGDELAAIDKQAAASRHADYLAFSDPSLKTFIEQQDIHHIGYRELKKHLG